VAFSAWSPHYDKDRKLLEKMQRRFTRMFTGLQGNNYYDRLRNLRHLNVWTIDIGRKEE